MQINVLKTLVMISRVKSFSRTAELLNMTLSTVSMQMKSLEEELSAALFDRTFRPPKFTPLGEQIAQDAQNVLKSQAILKSRCARSDQLTGHFRMGFVPSSATYILPDFLKFASQNAQQAQFDLALGLSENLCERVQNGQLDAALVTEIPDTTYELKYDRLVREEMVVVAPPGKHADNLVDLAKSLPFIHFMPHSGIGKLIAQYCLDMRLEPHKVIVLDSIEAIVGAVQRNLGYSLLPKPAAIRYGGENTQIFSCVPNRIFRQLSLVTRKDTVGQIWQPNLFALLKESLQ